MNPGTYYLYEYADSTRKRTIGFMKIERHYRSCILQLHAKGLPVPDGDLLSLNAFFGRDNKIIYSKIAEVSSCRKGISARLAISERDFPENAVLTALDGFFLQQISGDPSLLWIASSVPDLNMDMLYTPDRSDVPELHAAGQDPPDDLQDPSETPEDTTDTPANEADPENSDGNTDQWNVRKIKRSDLSLLPRKFWPLANNSFLLHGYHNYGHLILLEESGYMWLGVPGIYDPREARAADLFGFSRFTRTGAQILSLSEEECSESENFGHWCRYLGSCSSRFSAIPDRSK